VQVFIKDTGSMQWIDAIIDKIDPAGYTGVESNLTEGQWSERLPCGDPTSENSTDTANCSG
jgi:hypothetical protein